ncbi:unnamed protein product [Adineta steineri]|uniref:Uncharacterized protein n=1 Tax=Adineta steineri TaxID=433720 RepID=A0A818T102_9BILA|nr:unnamed protein product [Adineta steineri]CAF3675318.1 unnamed protein product [Adineta steineri]
MKRITQILASVFFVITVVTIYFGFDFAINNAISNKNSSNYRSIHNHDHHHAHDNPVDAIKITKRRSVSPSLPSHSKKSNGTMKDHNEHEQHSLNNEHRLHKKKHSQAALRVKPGNFHKGKTGVKLNKPRKSTRVQRKRLTTTTTTLPQHRLDNKQKV